MSGLEVCPARAKLLHERERACLKGVVGKVGADALECGPAGNDSGGVRGGGKACLTSDARAAHGWRVLHLLVGQGNACTHLGGKVGVRRGVEIDFEGCNTAGVVCFGRSDGDGWRHCTEREAWDGGDGV